MAAAIAAGIRFFQYRNKSGTRRDIYETSLRLASLAAESGALFIVNDHADIAAAVDADGVHLGQDDLPIESRGNCSAKKNSSGYRPTAVNRPWPLKLPALTTSGSARFRTTTKDAGEVQGCAGIVDIKQAVSIPVIAIGGITHENVQDVMRPGPMAWR